MFVTYEVFYVYPAGLSHRKRGLPKLAEVEIMIGRQVAGSKFKWECREIQVLPTLRPELGICGSISLYGRSSTWQILVLDGRVSSVGSGGDRPHLWAMQGPGGSDLTQS